MRHSEATDHLADFAAGLLDPLLIEQVRIHTRDCAECRHWLELHGPMIRMLTRDVPPAHPSSRELAICATAPHEEHERGREALGDHLRSCPDCRSHVDLVRAAISAARPSGAETGGSSSPRISPRSSAQLKAAAGFAGVALISALVFFHFVRPAKPGREAHPPAAQMIPWSEAEIAGHRVIDADSDLLFSRTTVSDGADLTIRSSGRVAFGNGFRLGSTARMVVVNTNESRRPTDRPNTSGSAG